MPNFFTLLLQMAIFATFRMLMLKKRHYILTSIGLICTILIFINYSFSSADSANAYDTEFCDDFTIDADVNLPIVDYKSILGNRLDNFTSLINYKAKRARFHGVVWIAYKDQLIFEQGYGYQDPTTKEKMTMDAIFELASISKQYTAAATLKLVEQNKLDIELPLKHYFPDFKFETVKVKHLLKHSSGLWNYMYLTEAYWSDICPPENSDILDLINNHQRELDFRAGTRFNYSNTNYALLVALVERISKQNFESFLNEHFFQPYCIENTYLGADARHQLNGTEGFQPYGRGYVKMLPSKHNSILGDKGVHTTANGLWQWFKSLKNYESLDKNLVEQMFNKDEYKFYNYGMGFRTKADIFGVNEIYHDGLWDGFRNGLRYFPEEDLTVIVLSHTQNKNKGYFQSYLKNKAKSMISEL